MKNEELTQPFFLPGGDHAILLTHGFTSTPASVLPLARLLNEAGYTVMGIRLKGHGTVMEDMLKANWRDWLRQEKEAMEKLKKEYATVTAAGLSMGGVLSLLAAERMGADSCVAISAPMKVHTPGMSVAKVLAIIKPTVSFRSHGPAAPTLMKDYAMGYRTFPTKSSGDLHHLMMMARSGLKKICCPLLVIQSTGDRTIRQESAGIIMNGAKQVKAEYMELQDYPHACTVHTGACEAIAERIIAFLKNN